MTHKESEYNYDYYRESNSYRTTNNNTLISYTKLGQQIDIRYIYELKGLFFTNPLLSLSLCISLFSMAGIPPVKNYGKILYWGKLSNSGDILKLLIPSYSLKAICGWSNYSGKVTTQKMNENEMGNRGSKSVLVASTVKEQRVDGSCSIKSKLRLLRCTLTGGESSYQVKIPSKQLKNKRTFSTVNIQPKLNPWFVTGFSDAESSFIIRISKNTKNKRTKIGWIVSSNFQITLHQRDLSLLLMLQQFFGGIGKINIDPKHESSKYTIIKLNDLKNVIIPHFEKYPLLTQKYADFFLFQRVVEIISNKKSSFYGRSSKNY